MSIAKVTSCTGGSSFRPRSCEIVAFVLQGGGSFSATQVGMLRALTESGVRPDLIVGSSAGALNAVAFASAPTLTGLGGLEALWLTLHRSVVAPLSPRTLFRAITGRGGGLVSNEALRRLLLSHVEIQSLDQAVIPVHVVATEMRSGQAVVLSDGDPVLALLASAAFPGIYPPVRVGSRELIDGGVSADIPVLQAERLGATFTFILPAAVEEGDGRTPRGPLPLAYRALGQILDSVAKRDIASARGQVLTLPTVTSRATNPVDFHDTARLIQSGYQLTTAWLTQLAAIANAV
jgi:NTE family protein